MPAPETKTSKFLRRTWRGQSVLFRKRRNERSGRKIFYLLRVQRVARRQKPDEEVEGGCIRVDSQRCGASGREKPRSHRKHRRSIREYFQGGETVTVEMMTKLLADAEAYFGRPQTAREPAQVSRRSGRTHRSRMCRMIWPIRHSTR